MSLRVWLPLNGDLHNQGLSNISVTNNGATVNNNGKIGKCYYFNGSSQYLQLSKSLTNLYAGDFSWAIWLKPVDATRGIIFSEYSSTGASNVAFELLANRVIRVYWAASPDWSTGVSIEQNVWSHVAITRHENILKVYVNGELKATKSDAILANKTSSSFIRLGDDYRGGTSVSYMGYMNDARIYDHALSAKEIEEIAKGLVLHYKLDDKYVEPTTNLASTEASGWNNSGTCTRTVNDTTILNPPTPSNTYSIRATSDGSMAAQIGPTSANHPSKTIVASTYVWLDGTQDSSAFYLRSVKTDSSVGNLMYNGNSNPTTWPQRQWIRIMTNPITTASDATKFYICTYVNKNTEVRAFNGWQIEENNHITPWVSPNTTRNAGPNLITGLVQGANGSTTIQNNNTVVTSGIDKDTYFYIKTSAAMVLNHLYHLSCIATGLDDGAIWNFPIGSQNNTAIGIFQIKNGYNEIYFVANDTCVNAGKQIILDDAGISSGTRAVTANFTNFILQEITSNIYDSSGYGNNGTIVGSLETTTLSPRYSCATYINSLDPTTDSTAGEYYISANCALTTPSTISISWWSYPENGYGGSATAHGIWSTTANDIASDYQVSAFNHRDFRFDVNSSDGQHLSLSTSSFVGNAWHHYVVTYDGQTAKLYKDGVQQTSVAFSAAKTLGSFTKVLIGHSRAGGVHRKVKGKYSDFRIYATALTDVQVQELYKTSMLVSGNTITPRNLA